MTYNILEFHHFFLYQNSKKRSNIKVELNFLNVEKFRKSSGRNMSLNVKNRLKIFHKINTSSEKIGDKIEKIIFKLPKFNEMMERGGDF